MKGAREMLESGKHAYCVFVPEKKLAKKVDFVRY